MIHDVLLIRYRKKIEARMAAVVRTISPAALRTPIAHVVHAGGKRLRPLIAMLACEAAGGRADDALDAAVAIELLHTFTLVHDDIMDNAALRRGRATVHTRWDANTAILAGDTIAALAAESLARPNHSRTAAIARQYSRAFVDVCVGQALDKELEQANGATMPTYLRMIDMKTAALFSAAAAMGGITGTASGARVKALERFGRELGLAFQIRDDALDVGADPAKFGKDAGSDIREGKKTFLFVAARGAARGARDAALLKKYIARQGLRGADARRLCTLYVRCGALTRAEHAIDLHTGRALRAVQTLPASAARTRLEMLARAMTGRMY